MTISVEEVFETASMILYQNLDIRTTTMGINLKDCIDNNFGRFTGNVYDKINSNAGRLVNKANELELKYGIPIVNKRISITPVSLIMETHCEKEKFVEMAKAMDRAVGDAGIDFIGGFGAIVHKGLTPSDKTLIESLPDVFSETERV
jgi:uncharacterized protein (UPF0210 family)